MPSLKQFLPATCVRRNIKSLKLWKILSKKKGKKKKKRVWSKAGEVMTEFDEVEHVLQEADRY